MNRVIAWIASWADTFRVAVYGPDAWDAFQQQAALLKQDARAKHKPIRHIEKRQRDIVHSALSRSIPTAPVADGRSRPARA